MEFAWILKLAISLVKLIAMPAVFYYAYKRVTRMRDKWRESSFLLGRKGRKLGATESLLDYAQERFGFMVNVNVLLVGCTTEVQPEHAIGAVQKVCQRHPVLRSVTKKSDSRKPLERYLVEEKNYMPEFDVIDSADWRADFHKEIRTNFMEGDGLWRVKMFQPTSETGSDGETKLVYPFIFTFNHCSIDGASIMNGVHRDFLHYLEAEINELDITVESLPLLDTREQIFKELKIGFLDHYKLLYNFIFGKSDLTERDVNADHVSDVMPPTYPKRSATKILTFTLDENECKKMISKCKQMSIKVNGFVTAAVALATRELLVKHGILNESETATFKSAFMVNLRRFASPPIHDENLGKLNSMVSMEIEVPSFPDRSPKRFAKLAEELHRTVHSKLNNNDHFRDTKSLDFAAANFGVRLSQVLLEMEGKAHLFYVTNRGCYHFDSNETVSSKCTFEGTYWATAEHMAGWSLFTHSLCSANDRVYWTMAYSSHMVHEKLAEEYIGLVKEIILQMCED